MIEINLLPGGKRKQRRAAGPSFDFSALKELPAKIKDPYMLGGVAGLALGLAAVAVMYVSQGAQERRVAAAEEAALKDSTNFSRALAQKVRAEATRDTVLRQLNVIRSIDDDRFIWPHVMDEVNRALPPYTWLTALSFTGTPQGTVNPVVRDTTKKKEPAGGAKKQALDTAVVREDIKIRVEGRTVDIQALTRFMRELEASPFIGSVSLDRSEMLIEQGKDITAFTLQMKYTRPDPSVTNRVPMTIAASTGGQ